MILIDFATLARKYTLESVLKYDDEYRILQHTYGYPWSFDNSHLHKVILKVHNQLFGQILICQSTLPTKHIYSQYKPDKI